MKTKATLTILLIATQISFAQERKLWFSLGTGINQPSNENKDNLIGNGFNIQADAFVPFYSKGSHLQLGVNVLGNYASVKNLAPDNATTQNQYQIYSGTLSVASQASSKTSSSFSGLLGLQGRFSFGKLNVSPSLNAGYLNFKKAGYQQIGSANINGQTRQLDLISTEAQNSGGLVFKPQVKVGYNLTSSISVFLSPAMVIGHEVAHTVQQRVPQGGFNDRNTYEASQLANGTWESKTNSTRYQVAELNFGLSVALGTKRKTAAPSGSANARQTPNTSFGQRTETNQQAAAINNPLYDGKGTQGNNPMHEQKTVVTTPKQTQGKTFGESMAGGLQAAENSNENPVGKATLKEFSVTKKTEAVATENVTEEKLNENGTATAERRRVEVLKSNKTAALDGRTYTGGRKNEPQNNNDEQAKPGNPIGGIIVKGGKNPGGNMSLQSNDNGEVVLGNLQKGNYLFQLSNIETAGKSINEKGVKRAENAMAKPGQPIGGIVVKGGKNPGGSFINLTVNGKGQVGFEVLEAGNYKLVIETPPASNPNSQSKKKVVEKATSGLKDTLKTNV